MKYTTLGKSNIKISAVTLGCMTFSGGANWGPQDEKESIETIRAALEAGITSFDTAETYAEGLTECILGKALGADRHKVAIFSKLAPAKSAYENVIAGCEGTLQRLGTDYLDLFQIHWPSRQVPFAETMEALKKLKQDGKVREIGICNFGVVDLDEIMSLGEIATNQLCYNLLWRGIEYSILPKCRENGIGVLTYSSLAQGLLTGKYRTADSFPVGRARTKLFSGEREFSKHGLPGCEEAVFQALDKIRKISEDTGIQMDHLSLAWILAQSGITSVIAGGRTPAQALSNAQAGNIQLSRDVVDALSAATEEVKIVVGDDADPWIHGRIR